MPDSDPQRADFRDDAIVEPENSTVDDWHGQEVDAEMERADELVDAEGGDETAAESRFEAEERDAGRS